jgi:hypothetical protein
MRHSMEKAVQLVHGIPSEAASHRTWSIVRRVLGDRVRSRADYLPSSHGKLHVRDVSNCLVFQRRGASARWGAPCLTAPRCKLQVSTRVNCAKKRGAAHSHRLYLRAVAGSLGVQEEHSASQQAYVVVSKGARYAASRHHHLRASVAWVRGQGLHWRH